MSVHPPRASYDGSYADSFTRAPPDATLRAERVTQLRTVQRKPEVASPVTGPHDE